MPSLQAVGSDGDGIAANKPHQSPPLQGGLAFTPGQNNRNKGWKTNSSAIQPELKEADVKPPQNRVNKWPRLTTTCQPSWVCVPMPQQEVKTSVPVVPPEVHRGRCARHLERLTSARKLQRTWRPFDASSHCLCAAKKRPSCERRMPARLLVDIIKCVHISDAETPPSKKKKKTRLEKWLLFTLLSLIRGTVLCSKHK